MLCDGHRVDDADGNEQTFTKSIPIIDVVALVATFEVGAESFKTIAVDPETIQILVDIWQGYIIEPLIPIGRLHRGPGVGNHNSPWSWHMNPLAFAENAVELCDGLPSHVDQDLDYWIGTVKQFCPWSAKLVGLDIWR